MIHLFAPCFLSLRSHSLTNVKRISSLHESSHSTRTKMVSRMAVIQTVSKLTDTYVLSCSQCRSHVRPEGKPQVCFQVWEPHGDSLQSSLFSVLFWCRNAIITALIITAVHFVVILYDPVSLQRSSRYSPTFGILVFWLSLLAAHCFEKDRSVGRTLCPHFLHLLLMLWLSSLLSFFCSDSLWTANRTSWG